MGLFVELEDLIVTASNVYDATRIGQVDEAVRVEVDLADHALELGLRRALAERGHHLAELDGLDPGEGRE